MTIGIVQTAFLGDIVIALGMAQSIKAWNADIRVVFVTTPAGAEFAELVREIDTVLVYDKRGRNKGVRGILSMASELKQSNLDVLLAPHRSFRTSFICAISAAKRTIGFSTNSLSWLYDTVVPYKSHAPEYERNHALVCQVFPDATPVHARFNAEMLSTIFNSMPGQFGLDSPYVVVAPGSVWATKRYPIEHFRAVTKSLVQRGLQVFAIGSSADKSLCDQLEEEGATNVCGSTNLQEFAALIAHAAVVVGNDSSPTHVANATNTPVVCIFGPTVPAFGFAPTGIRDVVLEQHGLDCRPCSPHGTAKCPQGHFKCMLTLDPSCVVDAVRNILEK